MSTTDVLYTAEAQVTGGRTGTVRSRSGTLDVALARPAERGTSAGTDPEELFAAAYAACFDSALGAVARRHGRRLSTRTATARVALLVSPEQAYSISVELVITAPDTPTAELAELVHEADTMCPYSKALRGNVAVTLTVVGRD